MGSGIMNTKTMEGIVGARTNMNLTNTPMRVYKEARRKGDMAVMERAMGYVHEFSDKAEEYKAKAHEGMKEEGEEVRNKLEAEEKNRIEKRKEKQEELKKRIENNENNGDVVEISKDGKTLWKENREGEQIVPTPGISSETNKEAMKMEPVIYTRNGTVSTSRLSADPFLSV